MVKKVTFSPDTTDPPHTLTCRKCGYRKIIRKHARVMATCAICKKDLCDRHFASFCRKPDDVQYIIRNWISSEKVSSKFSQTE